MTKRENHPNPKGSCLHNVPQDKVAPQATPSTKAPIIAKQQSAIHVCSRG